MVKNILGITNTSSGEKMNVEKLIELCDEFFLGYWEQEYAGANKTCVYCQTTMMENGKGASHSASCPVVRYEEIKSEPIQLTTEIDYKTALKRIVYLIDSLPIASESKELDDLVRLVEKYEQSNHPLSIDKSV
jgi:hypothetical protein